jgi:hypothetical protein
LNKNCEKVGVEFTPNQIGKIFAFALTTLFFSHIGKTVFFTAIMLRNKKNGSSIFRERHNVDVGLWAIIIGDVENADDCVIGAGACN